MRNAPSPPTPNLETRLLQLTILLAALVPVLAGIEGVLRGPAMAGAAVFGAGPDSQFRYLSGVLAGVGVAYWMLVPAIETAGERLFMLTLIVVVGGFCRATGMLIGGPAGPAAYAALAMELIVAPAVYLWQTRLARRAQMDAPSPWR
jgi:hypothetical protein